MKGMDEIHEIIKKVSPFYKKRGNPEISHRLIYDSFSDSLEPVYFWIIDLMEDLNLDTEKLIDNFTSSPGSGHFAELGQRASVMQQQSTKILGDVNTVLRSVLNIIYDLKDFRIRLQHYDDLKSKDKDKKEAALLSLKQIWMDKVDIQKGNSSIKAMSLGQVGFQTLIDGFLVAKNEKDVNNIDLNERVKRLIKMRISEFNIWLEQSEKELKKRYELEKNYLESQVNSLKLYSRWIKPYLKAAQELEQKEQGRNPDLVKSFNSILLELTLFGKEEIKPPEEFGKIKVKRKYYSCVLVDFYFRGIPRKFTSRGDYTFGGRTEVTFRGYSLNEEEIEKLYQELEKSDMEDVLKLIEGSTGKSLENLKEEINFFLDEKETKKEEIKKEGSNPFLALIGYYNSEKKEVKKEEKVISGKKIRPDDWFEKTHLRSKAIEESKDKTFDVFDKYKGAHDMASYT
jgi:hypothetical protein